MIKKETIKILFFVTQKKPFIYSHWYITCTAYKGDI